MDGDRFYIINKLNVLCDQLGANDAPRDTSYLATALRRSKSFNWSCQLSTLFLHISSGVDSCPINIYRAVQ